MGMRRRCRAAVREALSARREISRFFPQGDAAKQSVQIRYDGHISRKPSDIHLHGIAAADVEMIIVKHFFEFGDDLEQPIVPQLLPQAFKLGATESILSDLQIRDESPIHE